MVIFFFSQTTKVYHKSSQVYAKCSKVMQWLKNTVV